MRADDELGDDAEIGGGASKALFFVRGGVAEERRERAYPEQVRVLSLARTLNLAISSDHFHLDDVI